MVVPPQALLELGFSTEQLDCAGVKLTLCEVYELEGAGEIVSDSKSIPRYIRVEPNYEGVFELLSGSYIVRYCEYVKIPEDSIALAIPRSSLLRSGVALFTAVWDPGYEGRGYGLMSVLNKYGVKLGIKTQIAQLVYVKLTEKSALLYRGTYYLEK
ncbi:MAG: deoxyuridine 5'-triphosphate nucleotidohydrolase [Sulfolobales archaeon]|nr:deoxyuridine 5'-triphosphate nucleotidohydrolase [Sulfolobales archaeon]MDW8083076.1 deoxyuridine 5'-triphosphate nucleotidohydrolase [Sulfolobales archaeon]